MPAEKASPMREDLLPRKCDVIWHYKHLLCKGLLSNSSLFKTSALICEIWSKADCPPKSLSNVRNNIESLLKELRCFKPSKSQGAKHCGGQVLCSTNSSSS